MIFSLYEHPDGVETDEGSHVVYDVEAGEAHLGAAQVPGAAIEWELADYAAATARVVSEVDLFRGTDWLMRGDRVELAPGGGSTYEHPGPAICRLLSGSLRLEGPEGSGRELEAGDAWIEAAEKPVTATASETEPA